MNLDEARGLLRDDNAGLVRWTEAAGELCHSSESSWEHWLLCLSRRGSPAEFGAIKLYNAVKRQTGRIVADPFEMDADDWYGYLRRNDIIN